MARPSWGYCLGRERNAKRKTQNAKHHSPLKTQMLSIIIPTYNAQSTLEELCRRINQSLLGIDYELILVNDASTDVTGEMIYSLQGQYPQIRCISNPNNFGQHPTIFKGLNGVRGKYIVVMDCDLQDKPEDIPTLYKNILETEVEAVLAKRNRKEDQVFKKYGSVVFYALMGILFPKIPLNPAIGNFGIYHKDLIQRIVADPNKHFFPISVQKHVKSSKSISVDQGFAAKSNYSALERIRLALSILKKERSLA